MNKKILKIMKVIRVMFSVLVIVSLFLILACPLASVQIGLGIISLGMMVLILLSHHKISMFELKEAFYKLPTEEQERLNQEFAEESNNES